MSGITDSRTLGRVAAALLLVASAGWSQDRTEQPAKDNESVVEPVVATTRDSRRDPFKLPAPPAVTRKKELSGPRPPGRQGLAISELKVTGIVREDKTHVMIAVVTNDANRAYFLREHDSVYDGVVTRITPDSVSFMENYLDPEGRVKTREVVKRLNAVPGETK